MKRIDLDAVYHFEKKNTRKIESKVLVHRLNAQEISRSILKPHAPRNWWSIETDDKKVKSSRLYVMLLKSGETKVTNLHVFLRYMT